MTLEQAVEYALTEGDIFPAGNADEPGVLVDPLLVALTPREREVATLVAQGLSNRQVATGLSISERTAANHVAKIMRKLGLSSRGQIGEGGRGPRQDLAVRSRSAFEPLSRSGRKGRDDDGYRGFP